MRLCQFVTCDAAADLYYKGPWCARHAVETYGAVIGTLTRIESPSDGHARPPRRLGAGTSSSEGVPSSAQARPAGSLDRPEPAPLTEAELFHILQVDGWDEIYNMSLAALELNLTVADLERRLVDEEATT